jgi:hypothetical protein
MHFMDFLSKRTEQVQICGTYEKKSDTFSSHKHEMTDKKCIYITRDNRCKYDGQHHGTPFDMQGAGIRVTNNLTVKKLLSWILINQFGQGKLS